MQATEAGTAERILLAALRLMREKGFKAVTIKDIAQASQVSEMTVFRHFETKKGVLEAAVAKYSYLPGFRKLFDEMMVWDLERDLERIAGAYLEAMHRNESIFLIAVQERTNMPELADFIAEQTGQLKAYIAAYFMAMQDRKKMAPADANMQAMAFLTMLYGYFSSTSLWGTRFIREPKEQFVPQLVANFCNGIKI